MTKWRTTAWWIALGGCLVVFFALRVRGIGHLLNWDEAVDLLTSLWVAGGAKTCFVGKFWVHPPAHILAISCLAPFEPGLAERAELLAIVINALVWAAMAMLNRKTFGASTALWSAFFLAVAPGSVQYDAWIKCGAITTLFGVCAILFLGNARPLLAASCLGLAFLDKETALFFAFGIGLLALADKRIRRLPLLAAMGAIVVAISAWWFVCFNMANNRYVDFALNASYWFKPWHFYLVEAYRNLGATISVFAVVGVAVTAVRLWRAGLRRPGSVPHHTLYRAWPLAMLVPSYALLSALPTKVPWVVNGFYPGLATLAGAGMAWCTAAAVLRRGRRRWSPSMFRVLAVLRLATIAAVAVGILALAVATPYENPDSPVDRYSLRIAETVNNLATNGQNVLVTAFHFFGPDFARTPSAVFCWYLRKDVCVFFVPNTIDAETCVNVIRSNRIDWAVLSPMPDPGSRVLMSPLVTRYGLQPVKLPYAWVFPTASLYANLAAPVDANVPSRAPGVPEAHP